MNYILTGATGFIGSAIADALVHQGHKLTVLVRERSGLLGDKIDQYECDLLDSCSIALDIFRNVDCVIHAAGRAHVMRENPYQSVSEYFRINVDGTHTLAQRAASAGVRRFIFISSVGVNGITSNKPFNEEDIPNPADQYAKSKLAAEIGLFEIQKKSQMEIVVVRPPLVYGPNAPGNFGRLVRWVNRSLPLPLGAVHNKRTLVSLYNLVDLIVTCINHPKAANQVFLAGDAQDLSTTELLRRVANAACVPSRLVPVPISLLKVVAFSLGQKSLAQRLLGSLQIDISKARELLEWEPPLTIDEGLSRCFEAQTK